MSEISALPVRRPRLNPFAFPSDTTLRFVLLVIFVVCGSGKLYRLFGEDGRTDHSALECMSRNVSKLSRISTLTSDENGRFISSVVDCLGTMRHGVWWSIGGIFLTIVTAAIFYWLYPVWKLRSGRLERLSSSDLPEVVHELLDICQAASLPNPPIFVWNPVAAGLPLAFGRGGKYYVALSGSFIARYFYRDRHAFRAILLHELAHIRNGDINKTYLVVTLWLAFLTTTIAPSLLIALWFLTNFYSSDAIGIIVYGIIWTGVVTLSGLAVLRTREYYADVRASVWSKASHVDRVLAELPTIVGKGWRRYFRFHPGSTERRQIVEDPSQLFRLSYFDAFGIGIAAWSIVEVLRNSMLTFFPKGQWEGFAFLGLILVILPAMVLVFAVGAIGIGVWRGAFASLLKGNQPYKRAGWLGAAFVAGSFPGSIVALVTSILQGDATQSTLYSLIIAVTVNSVVYVISVMLFIVSMDCGCQFRLVRSCSAKSVTPIDFDCHYGDRGYFDNNRLSVSSFLCSFVCSGYTLAELAGVVDLRF
jgi:Zn-dependent protease with chaperone function